MFIDFTGDSIETENYDVTSPGNRSLVVTPLIRLRSLLSCNSETSLVCCRRINTELVSVGSISQLKFFAVFLIIIPGVRIEYYLCVPLSEDPRLGLGRLININ